MDKAYAACPTGYHFDASLAKFWDPNSGCVPNEKMATPSLGDPRKTECAAVANQTDEKCMREYSCETLFQSNRAVANKCNWERCVAKSNMTPSEAAALWMNFSCNCKYGLNWAWDKWIPLNTNFPFIGRCIVQEGSANDAALSAFPVIINVFIKMFTVLILVFGIILIIAWGIMRSAGKPAEWKKLILKVVIGFLLLGAMGAILNFINPNFFR